MTLINFRSYKEILLQKKYSFIVTDITLPSDNPLRFQKNLLQEVQSVIMTINDKIRDEELQYDITRATVNISALSSGKIYKYEYLTSKKILPLQQHWYIPHWGRHWKNKQKQKISMVKTSSGIKIFRISWQRIIINKKIYLAKNAQLWY